MNRKVWRDADVAAYLDGELNNEQRAGFEVALTQNSDLRQKVAEQRHAITVLRDTPLRTPPRNYLLTPAMVAKPAVQSRVRPRRTLQVMRIATSLAAVVFVIAIGIMMTPQIQQEVITLPASVVEHDGVPMADEAEPMFSMDTPAVTLQEETVVEKEAVIEEGKALPEAETDEQQRANSAPSEAAPAPKAIDDALAGGTSAAGEESIEGDVTTTNGEILTDSDTMLSGTLAQPPPPMPETPLEEATDATSVVTLDVATTTWDKSPEDVGTSPQDVDGGSQDEVKPVVAPRQLLPYVLWIAGGLTLLLGGITFWLSRRAK